MSRLRKIMSSEFKNPLDDFSREQLLRAIIEKTVMAAHQENNIPITSRDTFNMADAILDGERTYLKDLHDRIEENLLKQEKEDKENSNVE